MQLSVEVPRNWKVNLIELAKLGANVTLIACNENKLLNVLNELDKSKGQVFICLSIDFADTEKLKEKINLLKGIYHILINNTEEIRSLLLMQKHNLLKMLFSMHLVNNQILVQKVIDGMKSEGYGRIVNVISTSVKSSYSWFRSF